MPIRVLIVDDSAAVRKLLSGALSGCSEIEVAGTASNGTMALAKISQLIPDVIMLDIEMQGMNGIAILEEIRRLYPQLPVIIFSSFTESGVAITVEALAAGASDYLTKPTNAESLEAAMEQIGHELIAKIAGLVRFAGTGISTADNPAQEPWLKSSARKWPGVHAIDILAIGSSAGGPTALTHLIGELPEEFSVPVVVVQHMPPLFTRFLAERLDAQSKLSVKEARHETKLEAGKVWIAPGDRHMIVARRGNEIFLELNQEPPENLCRPAVDVLFRSVARTYGSRALAIVLSGMGTDGARGATHIREAGGEVLVQDQASSVVWGMPGAVVSAGAADMICPISEMGAEVIRRVGVRRVVAVAGK